MELGRAEYNFTNYDRHGEREAPLGDHGGDTFKKQYS